ncbi:hypothetical protein FVW20_11110 [Desulfovibrio oxamicus]|uniref:DUF2802 domain-containing protein n=1 Tax=Nitratidesulfovibrio oxamicus TaxID=32016 RepID=A0ABS0J540_9BACT|nr:hypothetical protein [Nitratidesulfovibrio oxamicus]MBG3877548.1 hypothetical protein [Nitratidesulfovibrio oxamicus]
MTVSLWLIILVSVVEVTLLGVLLAFFLRLRRSEALLNRLQANQTQLLERLRQNAELEQELVATFAQRQEQLRLLDRRLEERADGLRRLLEQAEGISRSPQFLREVILNGHSKGRSLDQIARSTGLSVDEVELILAQAG